MEPTDLEVRDRIRTALDVTLFVEAGAGTGKTTQLVQRIRNLVIGGEARIDEIAAITFTEAAAAELRDRIAAELDRLASSTAGRSVTEAQRERAGEALRGIDGAAITTIHGFARRILAEHPFAAGLPPVIEVLDEIRSQVDFEERWVQFIDRLSERPGSARPLTLALTCGVTVAHLREVAKQFNESWDRVPPPESQAVTVPVPDPARVLEPLRRALALAQPLHRPRRPAPGPPRGPGAAAGRAAGPRRWRAGRAGDPGRGDRAAM